MTTAQVVETSATVNNNSPIRDYVHPDDQTQPTNHFDSEDDYRTGCWNVSHRQQQQSYSELRSTGRSSSTFFYLILAETYGI